MVVRPLPSAGSRAPLPPEVSSEHWDAVLCYAEICTVASANAVQLATEACDQALRKIRELRAKNTLPPTWFPILLGAVRATTAAWLARGDGDRLHPGLYSRLTARAADPATARRRQPLALRAFQGMREPDRCLLWYVEVESAPAGAVAKILGSVPADAEAEVARVRQVFRQRCLRAHVKALRNETCRGYSRLLEVATRTPHSPSCPDLDRHLAQCDDCSEAGACLALHRGELPGALAVGLLGWGGLAYLEARRRAATDGAYSGRRARRLQARQISRGCAGRSKAAGIVALLAAAALLTFLMTPTDTSSKSEVAMPVAPSVSSSRDQVGGGTPAPTEEASPSSSADKSRSAPPPSHGGMDEIGDGRPGPEPPRKPPAPACKAHYKLVHQWEDGFRADVMVTYNRPVDGWQLTWSFSGGQHISQMWSGRYRQYGPRVTVHPVDYNNHVAAGQSFTVGFLADMPYEGDNPSPGGIALNGIRCAM